ncbi:endonuclease/exonuclease/phosphatase family protein [Lentibacter algarum]|nr:endonuclease/exonuclease/phosphatase family protein [Lentibacter algarum]
MAGLLALCLSTPLTADELRIAFFSADLSRKGPGLLLRDIASGKDQQIAAVQEIIKQISPDILLLSDFDYDADLRALNVFNQRLGAARYPHLFALRPNSGMHTGLDLNGDKRLGSPQDAQGFGYFAGQGGLALLSRYPINKSAVQDFSTLLWKDMPNALLPTWPDGSPFPSPKAQAVQRLSYVAHWLVPVQLPSGPLNLLAYQATPPVFDGPEDQNGKRNHDETAFWLHLLDTPQATPFVLLGGSNLDPADGDGRVEVMQALLAHPALQDPKPASEGGRQVANPSHKGDPALDTADWKDPFPGNMRVDYVLPSAAFKVLDAGVFWPAPTASNSALASRASRHKLVWVDVELP